MKICVTLKLGAPPLNRLGDNLDRVGSTGRTETAFLHSPINKGNNMKPLGWRELAALMPMGGNPSIKVALVCSSKAMIQLV